MSDGDRPLNNDWVLGPEPLAWPEGLGNVKAYCCCCGAPTKLIGRRLFCRKCGYFESCCDGGKQAIEGEC